MGMDKDRRGDQRLPLKLTVICQKVGQSPGDVYAANTVNVSSGGMLMEINDRQLSQGDLLSIEMSVPPTKGLLEYGGKFSSYARILRTNKSLKKKTVEHSSPGQTIALEFCASPKLNVL